MNTPSPASSVTDAAVLSALAALEWADEPVPTSAFAALYDPALREDIKRRLEACGRTLIDCGTGTYLSGYRDDVADELNAQGIGSLDTNDRAVLALVLMLTVAIPRAKGAASAEENRWVIPDNPHATTEADLAKNRHMTRRAIHTSLRRLDERRLIRRSGRGGILPGQALNRLTPAQSSTLWADLVIAADPASPYARVLLKRRAAAAQEATG